MDSAVYIDLVDHDCGMHQKHWKEWKKRMVTWDNGGGQN